MNITTSALFAVLHQQQSHTDYSESQSTPLGDQIDVESWKCNKTALINNKYHVDLIPATLSACCSVTTTDDQYGDSERIHLRHLASGIPVSIKRPALLE
jgi:hypothetical protein